MARSNLIRLRPALCDCSLTFTLDDSLTGADRELSVQLEEMEKQCKYHASLSPDAAHATIKDEGVSFNSIVSEIMSRFPTADLGEVAAVVSIDDKRAFAVALPDNFHRTNPVTGVATAIPVSAAAKTLISTALRSKLGGKIANVISSS